MAVPDFQTLMLPLLELAGDGQQHTSAEAVESLAQRFQLSTDDRGQLLQNGQPRFNNRVGWATTYLKKAGLLQAVGRGRFELTDRGKDEDHIGGLIALLASGEFSVRRVRLNSDAHKDSDIWNDLLIALDLAQRQGQIDFSPVLTVAENGLFDHQAVRLEILGPSTYLAGRGPGSTDRSGRPITTNSISAVIRVSVDGRRVVLFPGDIDQVGLDELLYDRNLDPHAEVLVFPHHGGRAGQTDVTMRSCAIRRHSKTSISVRRAACRARSS